MNAPQTYRFRHTVQAIQYLPHLDWPNCDAVAEFTGGEPCETEGPHSDWWDTPSLMAAPGDWIVRFEDGDFGVYDADDFHEMFEQVTE